MQQKMAAQQDAMKAEYAFQKQQNLAKAKREEAHGDADAMEIRALGQSNANKKLQSTLTPLLIEMKKIERWDGALPQVSGGQSLIDLRSKGEK